ncbi:MAG TPA: FCD domain-containing protein [Microbacterium sp.]|jgi:DNA-binding FadR family transcriptional regulator|nr:FCD domain-containing protein [Microbacterium sp.]
MGRPSHSSVLEDLGLRIAAGELSADSVLTLAELEQHYRISRTVIREAVRVLEAMGMLASRRRVGITVQPVEGWSALDARLIRWQLQGPGREQQIAVVTELRCAVEPVAARLSALRASDVQRAELLRLASLLERLGGEGRGDSEDYLSADVAFHDLILDSSGNLMLAANKPAIAAIITGRSRAGLTPSTPDAESLGNHVQTAYAIARGDGDAAERHARGYADIVLDEVHSAG